MKEVHLRECCLRIDGFLLFNFLEGGSLSSDGQSKGQLVGQEKLRCALKPGRSKFNYEPSRLLIISYSPA